MTILYNGFGKTITLSNSSNYLDGKKWLLIGDSITTMAGTYKDMLKNTYGLTEVSAGIGYNNGYQVGYANGENKCILEKLNALSDEVPDIITIALGTNDYGNHCIIGDINDDLFTKTNYTFIGCYQQLIRELYNKFPKVPILLMTPFPRNRGNDQNNSNFTLKDYADAIKKVGVYYSIPVCDLFSACGIPIGTLTDSNADNFWYTQDGLHMKATGASVIVPKLANDMNLCIQRTIVECISLTQSTKSYTLTDKTQKMIYATPNPIYSSDIVEWSSKNEDIVTVKRDPNYICAYITAVANGEGVVTAKCGNVTVDFDITVNLS